MKKTIFGGMISFGKPRYLHALHGVLLPLDVTKFTSGDPGVSFGPVVNEEEPREPPHQPDAPEDVEDRRPTSQELGVTEPSAQREADDGAKLHS